MTERKSSVLIVDDDTEYLGALRRALERDFEVTTATSAREAEARLRQHDVSLVLLDVRLLGDEADDREGLLLLGRLKELWPDLAVVMMTAYGDIDLAVEAMKEGAADFIQKAQVDLRELRKVLQNALVRSRLERQVAGLEDELRRLEPWELIGDHPKIHEVRQLTDLAAQDGHCTVLIRGETGTGKELIARAVHSRGTRKGGPFVAVSIPALAPELVAAELFGHTKRAFTDARETRVGYIEKASRGVLFLDEIGDLTPEVQLRLLRVLETRTFARVGSRDEIAVDIQVVAATNRDLQEAIAQGAFREDLYYRLKTFELLLPPLRERVEDIALLVDHFLFFFRQQGRTALAGINPMALECLARYRFPGNVRELRSLIERAMMLATARRHLLIEPSDLPQEVQGAALDPALPQLALPEEGIDLDLQLARVELTYIQEALQATERKKTEAWRLLALNDRFALRRRVLRIGERYPALVADFPVVRDLYYDGGPLAATPVEA
jgi:two-component system response regulator AtoC